VHEDALAVGEAESAELQLFLITEVTCDNAAGFAATLSAGDPTLYLTL
jgi:hypothetical protein